MIKKRNLTNRGDPLQVYNKKYWPHQFRMVPQKDGWEQTIELEKYCYENFKSGNWRNHGLYFVFKRYEDATLFALRWA